MEWSWIFVRSHADFISEAFKHIAVYGHSKQDINNANLVQTSSQEYDEHLSQGVEVPGVVADVYKLQDYLQDVHKKYEPSEEKVAKI